MKETALQQREFKRSRILAVEASAKRRKLNIGFAEEYRNVDKSRKTLQYTEAIPLLKKSRGNKSCGGAACESIKDENYFLKEQDQLATVASALAFRQLLCAQAFCNYSMHFLYKSDFKSRRKMYKFLYEILPRYISAFASCTGTMGTIRNVLAEKETKAWYTFNGMIPSQELAYLYCQDLLAAQTTSAKDLNLCEVCDQNIAGHPPKTCSMVTPKLSQEFSTLRAGNDVCWENDKVAFDRSPNEVAISNLEIKLVKSY